LNQLFLLLHQKNTRKQQMISSLRWNHTVSWFSQMVRFAVSVQDVVLVQRSCTSLN